MDSKIYYNKIEKFYYHAMKFLYLGGKLLCL